MLSVFVEFFCAKVVGATSSEGCLVIKEITAVITETPRTRAE